MRFQHCLVPVSFVHRAYRDLCHIESLWRLRARRIRAHARFAPAAEYNPAEIASQATRTRATTWISNNIKRRSSGNEGSYTTRCKDEKQDD